MAALAPRMPVITENVLQANRCDSTAKGYAKNKSRLKEEKENTGIRFNEPATNFAIRHKTTNGSRKRQHCCCCCCCSSNNSNRAAHRAAAAAAAEAATAAALCMPYKTDFSIAQTVYTSDIIVRIFALVLKTWRQRKNRKTARKTKRKKGSIRDLKDRPKPAGTRDLPAALLYFLHTYTQIGMFLYVQIDA